MANAQHEYTGTGSTALYPIPFPYISKAYVKFYQDGVLLVDETDYTWQSPTTILLTAGSLPTGSILLMRRETPKEEKLVDFSDGTELTEADLDLANDQVFHLVQESYDAIDSAIRPGEDGTFDMGSRRLRNVGPAVEPADAVNKEYADSVLPALVAASATAAQEAQGALTAAEGVLAEVAETSATIATLAASAEEHVEDAVEALAQFAAIELPLPVSSGGFGGTTPEEARQALELGSAALLHAEDVVQLDSTGKLPALDGSQLTHLPAAGLPSATSAEARGGTAEGVAITPKLLKEAQIQSSTPVNPTATPTITFTGIPAWARRITVMFSGISTNGDSPIIVRLGTASGIQTSGYLGTASIHGVVTSAFTTGFGIEGASSAGIVRHGAMILHLLGGNVWCAITTGGRSDINYTLLGAGSKSLGAVLTQLQVTTVGGVNLFNAGGVNISWE